MILIWKGRGLWVIPIAIGALLATEYSVEYFYADSRYYQENGWPKFAGGCLAGLCIWAFAAKFCSGAARRLVDENTGEIVVQKPKHSFFFIPVRAFAVLVVLFAAFVAFWKTGSDAASSGAPEMDWRNRNFIRMIDEAPGQAATIFAPGLISDGMDQRDSAYSAEQNHFLYTLQMNRDARIMHVHKTLGIWRVPKTASFSGEWRDLEPAFVPGTLELYFASNRPLPGEEEAGDFNLWRTAWHAGAWIDPVPLEQINTEGNEFYPSLTSSGDLYYTTELEGGAGGEDIWVARADGATDSNNSNNADPSTKAALSHSFHEPTPLGTGVNTAGPEFNAAIDPSGMYLAFSSVREDGPGGGDMYLSKRLDSGEFGPASLIAGDVNTDALDFCPFFYGTDGELWFTSRRAGDPPSAQLDLPDVRASWSAPANGLGDLYRVKLELP